MLAALIFTGFGCSTPNQAAVSRSQPVTLNYWRVFDDQDAFQQIAQDYTRIHPNITIRYTKLTYDEYRDKLLNALAEDNGPDMMSLHNDWMHEWQPRLMPMPSSVTMAFKEVQGSIKKETITVLRTLPTMTLKQMANDYIDVVAGDMVMEVPQDDPRAPRVQAIYGLPLSVDTLALYYNRDLLNNAGIPSPAADWKTFQDQVKKLTKLDETGSILQSGAALGTATNVERASDILALLMMQNGTRMTTDDGSATFDKYPPELAGRPLPPGAEALVFYTDFANPVKEVYSWNDKLPDSLQAFAKGQTAYYFGYAFNLQQIRQLNPKLNIGIAPFPQISADNQPVNYANYWAEAVSRKTKHPDEAWDFLLFAAKAEEAQKYIAATGKPTALRSLVNGELSNANLAVFASQLPTARSWYHGTNAAAVEAAFAEMIRSTLAGDSDPTKALGLGAIKVNQTIK
ncbi:MAG: hypothetical protein RLZZ324_299 [Candidatus Parcubacteria bacterium]